MDLNITKFVTRFLFVCLFNSECKDNQPDYCKYLTPETCKGSFEAMNIEMCFKTCTNCQSGDSPMLQNRGLNDFPMFQKRDYSPFAKNQYRFMIYRRLEDYPRFKSSRDSPFKRPNQPIRDDFSSNERSASVEDSPFKQPNLPIRDDFSSYDQQKAEEDSPFKRPNLPIRDDFSPYEQPRAEGDFPIAPNVQ